MSFNVSNKGFQITFENGNTISVQFGKFNYCENQNYRINNFGSLSELLKEKGSSNNAEIAIWDEDGAWHNFGSDEVLGYCSADDAAEFLIKAKNGDL